jgi:phosphonopyruvate decarboxylase
MIPAVALYEALRARGFRLFSGVPCSAFAGLIELLTQTTGVQYVPAANEGAALAAACGARLAGTPSVVLSQNSGFGNIINPLTSLAMPFRIPVLVLMSVRGDPRAGEDEPQHAVMGRVTEDLLRALGAGFAYLPSTSRELEPLLNEADAQLTAGHPFFILMGRTGIGPVPKSPGDSAIGTPLSPNEAIRVVVESVPDAAIVATTGFTARRLFTHDRPANFYMQGSMGHAIAIGLGVALSVPTRQVVVLDGDGAAIMHLGTMSTVGALAPANLLHVLLDNHCYESTGGQPTTSAATALEKIASASGYRRAERVVSAEALRAILMDAHNEPGPSFIQVEVATDNGADRLPRATRQLPPSQLARRFITAIAPSRHQIPTGSSSTALSQSEPGAR